MRRRIKAAWGGIAVIAAVILVSLLGLAIDTQPGRDFALGRIERLIAPQSGLRINASRLEGSLYGRLIVRDLELSDPEGVFFSSPAVTLDWRPARYLFDARLQINSISAEVARLHRLPRLRASSEETPLLPEFAIDVGHLEIGRLHIDEAVAGRPHLAALGARALIEDGRADIELAAASHTGGDHVRLRLDAEPDADRFDLSAKLHAPAGGLVAGAFGSDRAIDIGVTGAGSWSRWSGRARAQLAGGDTGLADLAVSARSGTFDIEGKIDPGAVFGGIAKRLAPDGAALDIQLSAADDAVTFEAEAASPNIRIVADGAFDAQASAFRGTEAAIRLLTPDALVRTLSGRALALDLDIGGPVAAPSIDYRFTADWFALGNQRIETPVATGSAQGPDLARDIGFDMRFTALRGAGDLVEQLSRGARVTGPLDLDGLVVRARRLAIRSGYLSGTAAALLDLRTGRYDVRSDTRLARYPIPGLGLVTADSKLRLFPDPAQPRKLRMSGPIAARLDRLDNGFLAFVFGGLPSAAANIVREPDGTVVMRDMRIEAPDLMMRGAGEYSLGQQIEFAGRGTQRRFGPLALELEGSIVRPAALVTVDSYFAGIEIADIRADFTPTSNQYLFTAAGSSILGPVRARGAIDTAAGDVAYRVERLSLAGVDAAGILRPSAGAPVSGTLALTGTGVEGRAVFTPEGDTQLIEIGAAARNAALEVPSPLGVRQGDVAARIRLREGAESRVAAEFDLAGVAFGKVALARVDGAADLTGGRGRIAADISGRGGRLFNVEFAADIGEREILVDAEGRIGRGRLALPERAHIERAEDGYRLRPVRIELPTGTATLSGRYGPASALRASFDDAGLEALGLLLPWADFNGRATGTLAFTLGPGGVPRGTAELRFENVSRVSGIGGDPIDIGVAARLSENGGALRAAFADGDRALGRLQLRLLSIPGPPGEDWPARLVAAPISAQLRYNGPAQSIWPLTGIGAVSIGGPLNAAIGAGGTLGIPNLTGRIISDSLRFESVASGTVIDNIELRGSFSGSQLALQRFSGGDESGGRVSGRGTIDLSFTRGFPIDLALRLDGASLIDIDTLDTRVSGPLTITSSPEAGARIGGELELERARYRPSQTAETVLPDLAVREINTDLLRSPPVRSQPTIWQLDVGAAGNNRIYVRGLGLDSEWSAKLKLGGVIGEPRLTGTADLIRGDYDFAGRRFELTRGEVAFQGEYPPDPILNIAAEARVEGLTAIIAIQGFSSRPEVTFSSVPSLPQDEILSRVLFGTSVANLSAAEAVQLAGAVAALREGGDAFDPVGAVRKAVGVDRLRILDNQGEGRAPGIAAGEYLGRRTYVELATDTEGRTVTQIEYALTRAFSVLGRIATLGGSSVGVRISTDY